uniref:Fibrinogen C-terminal domain-containing protein n=1 Tax=Amphimedon queenslandica TaxID=400682 RepID=A0A1X7T6N9_AMPQE
MLSLLILAIACLPQFISSSNLALTFDAANSTCTAACTTCSDTSNTDAITISNKTDKLLNELLNTTRNNSLDIEELKLKMNGIISSLSRIKKTATSNAGAINDILLLVEDLIIITHGSPRQHVWTLMAGLNEASYYSITNDGRYNCPCSQGSPQNSTLQSFIGNNYFCESGNPATDGTWQQSLYTSDPLWDGEGCGSLDGNCCTSRPSLPWFNKILSRNTTDFLELRVCGESGTADEDVPVSYYEFYMK